MSDVGRGLACGKRQGQCRKRLHTDRCGVPQARKANGTCAAAELLQLRRGAVKISAEI